MAGIPVGLDNLLSGVRSLFVQEDRYLFDFENELQKFFDAKKCFTINTGTAGLYIILKSIAKISPDRREVIIPAYTAPGIMLAIKDANLEPVLCDIELETFNMDINQLKSLITQNTLCVIAVNMFGIPLDLVQIEKITKKHNVFVIDDSAQAMGSIFSGKRLGNFGDVGITSFGRGKNISTYNGGCIIVNNEELIEPILEELKEIHRMSANMQRILAVELFAVSFAVRPFFYSIFYPVLSKFKSDRPHQDFKIYKYTNWQSAIGLSILKKIEVFTNQRFRNGVEILSELSDIKEIILPKILSDSVPAFNRFPIIIKHQGLREQLMRLLFYEGIESSIMYFKPLHHIFELGYRKDKEPFPNAAYLADRLITLPVHPLIRKNTIKRMKNVLFKFFSKEKG